MRPALSLLTLLWIYASVSFLQSSPVTAAWQDAATKLQQADYDALRQVEAD
jgi:hypothetical protein